MIFLDPFPTVTVVSRTHAAINLVPSHSTDECRSVEEPGGIKARTPRHALWTVIRALDCDPRSGLYILSTADLSTYRQGIGRDTC